MTTRKPDKPIKPLEEQSYDELVESLSKQQKLLTDGVAAKVYNNFLYNDNRDRDIINIKILLSSRTKERR